MQTLMPFATDNRLPEIQARLRAVFPPTPTPRQDPLRQLIYCIVSEGCAPAVGIAVFKRILARFTDWTCLSQVKPADLAPYFVGLPRAEQKARAIPEVLQSIINRHGSLDLDFLSRLTTDAAGLWLNALPGVTSCVVDAVLTFSSLERPVIAIGRETARIVRRLGLCPANAPLSAVSRHVAQRAPASWRGEDFAQISEGLRRLSRQSCGPNHPKCDDCPLTDLCPSRSLTGGTVIAFPKQKPSRARRTAQAHSSQQSTDRATLH